MEDELKDWYRKAMAARTDALQSAKRNYSKNPPEALAAIRRILHSIKGSGALYGFDKVSEAARNLDELPDAGLLDGLDGFIEMLKGVAGGPDPKVTHLLIVDDDPEIGHLLEIKLSAPNRKIHIAANAAQARQIIEQVPVSLILLDILLPDMDGRNLLVEWREQPSTLFIPVIVLSAKVGPAVESECRALGADDYIEKPFDIGLVSVAVSARLERAAQAERESRRDNLTGLPNRAALMESFDRLHALAIRMAQPLSLALLDFDQFKSINDTFGHAAGDDVLRRCCAAISGSIRASDVLARWGGEEFVVLFPNTDRAGAVKALEKAEESVRKESFAYSDGRSYHASFSAGVVDVSKNDSLKETLLHADKVLYLCKTSGGGRILAQGESVYVTKKKILFAEDDEPIALMVRQVLEFEGFEVLRFNDGQEAYAYAEKEPVSLVVMDGKMPKMGGFELLEKLRKLPAYLKTPMVMLTAYGDEKNILYGFSLGADDYILKPFSPPEFIARIRRLLKRK